MLLGLMLITYVPTISLGLVSLKNGHGLWVPFPERRIAMIDLEAEESMDFLSGVAQREQEMQEEQAEQEEQGPPDRPLTMEEILAQAQNQLEEEALDALLYESVAELLEDFRLVHSGRVRLADLALARELGIDIEEVEDIPDEQREELEEDLGLEPDGSGAGP